MVNVMGRESLSLKRIGQRYKQSCYWATEQAMKHSSLLLFTAGVILLGAGMSELALAEDGSGGNSGTARLACSKLLQYIEGGFGALVASAAGIGAIVAAAVGGFKAAWCLLVVSIGAFILRAYITLFNAGCG